MFFFDSTVNAPQSVTQPSRRYQNFVTVLPSKPKNSAQKINFSPLLLTPNNPLSITSPSLFHLIPVYWSKRQARTSCELFWLPRPLFEVYCLSLHPHPLSKLAVPQLRVSVARPRRRDPGSNSGQLLWDLWWTKWHWNRFSSSVPVSLVSTIPPMFHTHLHLHFALTRKTERRSLGTFQKAVPVVNRIALRRKYCPLVL